MFLGEIKVNVTVPSSDVEHFSLFDVLQRSVRVVLQLSDWSS